jgi:hypothetical protein
MGEYYGRGLISSLGMLTFLLSGIAGAFGFAWVGLHPMIGLTICTLLGAFGYNWAFRRFMRRLNRDLDEWESSIRDEREREFQRQLAAAKDSGDFDRFGQRR